MPKISGKRHLSFFLKLVKTAETEDYEQINEAYIGLSHFANTRMTKKKYVYLSKNKIKIN